MKFSLKDFFRKCDQIRRFLRIWSHLLKKSFKENFIFCAVMPVCKAILNQRQLSEKNILVLVHSTHSRYF